MQNLLPTMIILAAYYTVADIILWFQCIWYNKNNANKKPSLNRTNNTTHINSTNIQSKITSNSENDTYDGDIVENTTECEPMLTGDSIEHHSSAMRRHADTPTKTPEMEDIESRTTKAKKKENYINDLFIVTVVMFAGFLSWYISYCNNTDSRKSPKTPPSLGDSEKMNILAQIFGYLSAVLYLGSRIPQILLNFKRKSCEGVSLLFFLFACLGNINFILSVLAVSVSKKYLLVNASWLIGSAAGDDYSKLNDDCCELAKNNMLYDDESNYYGRTNTPDENSFVTANEDSCNESSGMLGGIENDNNTNRNNNKSNSSTLFTNSFRNWFLGKGNDNSEVNTRQVKDIGADSTTIHETNNPNTIRRGIKNFLRIVDVGYEKDSIESQKLLRTSRIGWKLGSKMEDHHTNENFDDQSTKSDKLKMIKNEGRVNVKRLNDELEGYWNVQNNSSASNLQDSLTSSSESSSTEQVSTIRRTLSKVLHPLCTNNELLIEKARNHKMSADSRKEFDNTGVNKPVDSTSLSRVSVSSCILRNDNNQNSYDKDLMKRKLNGSLTAGVTGCATLKGEISDQQLNSHNGIDTGSQNAVISSEDDNISKYKTIRLKDMRISDPKQSYSKNIYKLRSKNVKRVDETDVNPYKFVFNSPNQYNLDGEQIDNIQLPMEAACYHNFKECLEILQAKTLPTLITLSIEEFSIRILELVKINFNEFDNVSGNINDGKQPGASTGKGECISDEIQQLKEDNFQLSTKLKTANFDLETLKTKLEDLEKKQDFKVKLNDLKSSRSGIHERNLQIINMSKRLKVTI
ncbi:putative vacuolar amino acid transporter YPQ1 [Nakaseomyces glabratus]|nr:putative vacuolar amino acid transporter YPQ1 [Nakaseomyces glabratus]KTB27212.1 putative vacuolar amino acid transporter YPQ1 [Nakaseomyces glabratus]